MHLYTNLVHAAILKIYRPIKVRGHGSLHGQTGKFTGRIGALLLRLRPSWCIVGREGSLEVICPAGIRHSGEQMTRMRLARKGLMTGVSLYISGSETGDSKDGQRATYEIRGCSLADIRQLDSGRLVLCYVWKNLRKMQHLPKRTDRGTRMPAWIT